MAAAEKVEGVVGDVSPARPAGVVHVVASGLPGPGAAAFLDQVATLPDASVMHGRAIALADAKRAVAVACEFVELETDAGRSVGPVQSDADWHPHPTADGLYRLGPLVTLAAVQTMLAQIRDALTDHYHGGEDERVEIVGDLLDDFERELPIGPSPILRTLADEIVRLDARGGRDVDEQPGFDESCWPSAPTVKLALRVKEAAEARRG